MKGDADRTSVRHVSLGGHFCSASARKGGRRDQGELSDESAGCKSWHGSSTCVGESGSDDVRETMLEVFKCEIVRSATPPWAGVQDYVCG